MYNVYIYRWIVKISTARIKSNLSTDKITCLDSDTYPLIFYPLINNISIDVLLSTDNNYPSKILKKYLLMNELSVDQLSLISMASSYIAPLRIYEKFSIPSSLTNLVNVDSSSGLVKMSASCFSLGTK